MAPLIITERRIILFLISFIAGIICLRQLDHIGALGKPWMYITSAAFFAKLPFANSALLPPRRYGLLMLLVGGIFCYLCIGEAHALCGVGAGQTGNLAVDHETGA